MKKVYFFIVLLLVGCTEVPEKNLDSSKLSIVTLAGGCFWCMEAAFEALEGVEEVISGYSGGMQKNPSYEDVAYGKTDHLETVQIYYDSKKISYKEIIDFFWKQIDPTDDKGQFVDKGKQYTTAIFYANLKEKEIAEKSKQELIELNMFDKPIVTEIRPFDVFYVAEEYHQDYYKKRSLRYNVYKTASGRDQFKEKFWKN